MAWLHRASFRTPVADNFDAVAGFIALAEQDMNERLRARCMVIRTAQAIYGQFSTLPCDYVEMFDCRLAGGGPPLFYASRDQTANAYWQKATNSPPPNGLAGFGPDFMPIINPPAYPWGDGTPRRFSIVGGEIEWSPFPSAPEPIDPMTQTWPVAEMAYYQRINLGPAGTDTNSVLSTYPACYLYGSLIQSAPFLRDDSRVETWTNLYQSTIAGANAEHERSRTQGSRLVQTYRRMA
jgi:hypothetical protein